MKRYCRFLETVKDDDISIWVENKSYLVTFEDDNNFYFGEPVVNGISKMYKDKLYKVISVEE